MTEKEIEAFNNLFARNEQLQQELQAKWRANGVFRVERDLPDGSALILPITNVIQSPNGLIVKVR